VDDRTSITSGLKVGERVVTEGGDRLTDGGAVKLPGQRPGRPGAATGRWPGAGKGAAPGASPNGEKKRHAHRPQAGATSG
jgi:multidrug efflux system membrane fusion protein